MTQSTPSIVDTMREALEATAEAPHKRYPGQITDHIYSSDCPACVAQSLLRHWPHTGSTLPSDGVTIPAIPAGMKPWHGGDTAPEDWDGGPVLVRAGYLIRRPERGELNLWRHYAGWPLGDVIAYSPKPPMVANNGGRRCETCGERLDNDQRIPCHDCAAAPKAPPVAQAEGVERLTEALGLALKYLAAHEPGDSRAVSDEFVAMAAIHAGLGSDEAMAVIRAALSATTERGGGQ